jgi:DNA polymerase I
VEPRLLLIDATGLIFRAYYSIQMMSAPDGTPVNAVFGLVRMLLKVFRDVPATSCALAFDAGRTTFRTELYAEYKANRAAPPDELRPQFRLAIETAQASHAPVFCEAGFEADDIIATLCAQAAQSGMCVSVLTADHDLLQLLGPGIEIIMPQKFGELKSYTPEVFEAEYGFPVARFVDYKALRGDPSDNIPGVAGIGEKTAAKLVTAYGKLEQLYANIDLVKPDTVKTKLREAKDKVFLYRDLVTVHREMPISVDFSAYTLPDFADPEFQDKLAGFGFGSRVRDDAAKLAEVLRGRM